MRKKKKSQKKSNIEVCETNNFSNFSEKIVGFIFIFVFIVIIICSIYITTNSILFAPHRINSNLKQKLIPNSNIFRYTLKPLTDCTIYKIIETKDGKLALVGSIRAKNVSDFASSIPNAFIAKIDLNAVEEDRVVFFRECGGSEYDFFNDIIETEDECLIASGYTRSFDNDLKKAERYGESDKGYNWILKINPRPRQKKIIFNKCYDMENGLFKKMVESNGKLFFCTAPGNYTSATSIDDIAGIYREQILFKGNIIGIDPNIENEGGIFLNRVFGNDNEFYIFHDMLKARNGNLILSGGYKSNQVERNGEHNYHGGEDGFIMEFSPNTKSVVFFQCYGCEKSDKLYRIVECNDDGFIAVGEQLSAKNTWNTWILKTDLKNKSDYIFSKTYSETDLKHKNGYVVNKTYSENIKLSQLQFVENITEDLNFILSSQLVHRKWDKMIINTLEVVNIDSNNGKLHKDRIILDSYFNNCSNLLIIKTKYLEVVVVANLNGEFKLLKIPLNLEENNS